MMMIIVMIMMNKIVFNIMFKLMNKYYHYAKFIDYFYVLGAIELNYNDIISLFTKKSFNR